MATEIKRLKIRSSLEFTDGEGERETTATDTECELSRRDGGFLIRYTEGEGEAKCLVRLLYSHGMLTVKREGAVRSELKFMQGERLAGAYYVGAYGFDAEVYTRSLSITDKDGGILAELSYEMMLGGVSRVCEMVIELS